MNKLSKGAGETVDIIFGDDEENQDIKLARQCMDFKGLSCDNKDCINESCPLNERYGSHPPYTKKVMK